MNTAEIGKSPCREFFLRRVDRHVERSERRFTYTLTRSRRSTRPYYIAPPPLAPPPPPRSLEYLLIRWITSTQMIEERVTREKTDNFISLRYI